MVGDHGYEYSDASIGIKLPKQRNDCARVFIWLCSVVKQDIFVRPVIDDPAIPVNQNI